MVFLLTWRGTVLFSISFWAAIIVTLAKLLK